ncbi:hypothetical protein [Salarchaeum sp. JOR-1]|uniref:hypothetical protein n=1 Tax=Salarchaeum sp. JOR-1 TaxID=2599399 RepID=UPI0011988142|nr:hypothetical protein [Salarchaeum sp. JOR-1]QDX39921.1 hypothetical protein FQU85_03050 [Salarchaeum sp. JOR-1]
MASDRHARLVRFVTAEAGEYFRTGVRYTSFGWEVLYRRDDLPDQRLKERNQAIVDRVRDYEPLREEGSPFGDARASIELYEDGVLIHLREAEQSGVVLAFEVDIAQNLAGFVVKCRQTLQSS